MNLLDFFNERSSSGQPMVLATVFETRGSTYSKAGGQMLIDSAGNFCGMLSGGCLEGVVDLYPGPVDLAIFKITHDPRITSGGRILRKLSIDELPQLVCVIRGTMSMVGPRPALPDEVQQWDDEILERLRVLPGLTGMWQVSGRSDSSFEQYKRLDLYYVDNWSLAHDLRICWKTVPVVLSGSGAS